MTEARQGRDAQRLDAEHDKTIPKGIALSGVACLEAPPFNRKQGNPHVITMPRKPKVKLYLTRIERNKTLREQMGITAQTWSKRHGHDLEVVQRVLVGTADWSKEKVKAICVDLGIDPETGLLPIERQRIQEHTRQLEQEKLDRIEQKKQKKLDRITRREQEREVRRQARIAKSRPKPLIVKAEIVSLLQLDRL